MSAPVPDPVRAVLVAARGLVDAGPLEAAIGTWSAPPWRVGVAGRTGVGKSTLINAVAGGPARATGLGGVTTEAAELAAGECLWVDTPGLDGPARDAVPAALRTADAVVWVIDGLQPVTRTERRAMEAALPPGMLLHVVVARADLVDPSEHAEVLARVRTLTARWSPRTVRTLDLRSVARTHRAALADLCVPTPWLSARRREALLAALDETESAIAALPAPPDREAVRRTLLAEWRETVRAARDEVAGAIRAGSVDHRVIAERRFHRAAEPRQRAFVEAARRVAAPLGLAGVPDLPEPTTPEHGAVDITGGLGGAGAALRTVHGLAGRWMAEGQAALQEWLATGRDTEVERRHRARVLSLIQVARGALRRGESPPGPP